MTTKERRESVAKSPRRIGPAALAGIITATTFLLLVIAVLVGSFLSGRQVTTELSRIREAGEPITPGELEAFYALLAGQQDTTELWVAALAPLDSPQYAAEANGLPIVGEGGEIPSLDERWPDMESVDALLVKCREPLDKMHRAAELGGAAQFPLKFSDGVAMLLPQVQQLRGAVRLLSLEAEVRARRGDSHGAAESLQSILAAARSLERQPIMVSQAVRVALNGVALERLERLFPALSFADDDLARFDRDLAAIDYDAALVSSLQGERAIMLQQFADPSALGNEIPATAGWSPLRNADQAALLLLMKKYIDASQSTQVPVRVAMSQADAEVTAVLRSASARWRYPITQAMMRPVSVFFNTLCRGKAQRDAARCAIAVERYHRLHAELPQELDALVPEFLPSVPADPYDGAPLRYLRAPSGCKVYSLGDDLIDQQGARGDGGPILDIVFELKVPAGVGGKPANSNGDAGGE